MKPLSFDLDLDKHLNATLVVACTACGHEMRRHLKSTAPDTVLRCDCGHEATMTTQHLLAAQRRLASIKSAHQVAA